MPSRREQLRLYNIIENIDAIGDYLGERSFEQLYADRMRVDAIERCLQRNTEAVIKIGPERMAVIMPELLAGKVRGMGDILRIIMIRSMLKRSGAPSPKRCRRSGRRASKRWDRTEPSRHAGLDPASTFSCTEPNRKRRTSDQIRGDGQKPVSGI